MNGITCISADDCWAAGYFHNGTIPQSGCDGAPTPSGFALDFDEGDAFATFPFDASGGLLADGTRIWSWSKPSVRAAPGTGTQQLLTAPAIDEMRVMSDFVIGSDVPAGIDCAMTPGHGECLD